MSLESLGLGMILSWRDNMSRSIETATSSLQRLERQGKQTGEEVASSASASAAAAEKYLAAARTSLKIAAVGGAVVAGLLVTVKQASDSAQNMDAIEAGLRGIGRSAQQAKADVEALDKEIHGLTGNVNVTQEDLEKAAQVLTRGFGKYGGNEIAAILKPLATFSNAIKGSAVESADLLDTVFDTYGKKLPPTMSASEKAIKLMQMMANASAKFGMSQADLQAALQPTVAIAAASGRSFEELLVAVGALHKTGMKGGAAGSAYETYLRTIAMLQTEVNAQAKQTADSIADLIDVSRSASGSKKATWAEMLGLKIDDPNNLPPIWEMIDTIKNRIGRMNVDERGALYKSLRGQGGEVIDKLIQYDDSLKDLANQMDTNNAMEEQAEINNRNVGKSVQRLTEQIGKLSESIGKILTPTTQAFVDSLADMVGNINTFVDAHPTLTTALTLTTAALAGLALTGGLVSAAIYGIRAAWLVMNTALLTTPLGWIVLGIAAVIAGVVLLITYWDNVVAWVKKAFNWVQQLFEAFPPWVAMLAGPMGLILKYWDDIKIAGAAAWAWIKDAAKAAFDWITNSIGFKAIAWVFEKLGDLKDWMWGGDYSRARKTMDALGFDTWGLKHVMGLNPVEIGPSMQRPAFELGPVSSPVPQTTMISDFSSPRVSQTFVIPNAMAPKELAKYVIREQQNSWTFGRTGKY